MHRMRQVAGVWRRLTGGGSLWRAVHADPDHRLPPSAVPARCHQGWVQIGAAIAAVGYVVMGALNVATWGWKPAHHPGTLFAVALVAVTGWLVASRGRVLAGGLMALAACWVELHFSC